MGSFFCMAAVDAAEDCDDLTSAYIMALYGTETGDGDQPRSDVEMSAEAIASCVRDCKEFQEIAHLHLCKAYTLGSYDEENAGYDFWLSRNGHGAGFFCRDELSESGLGDALQELASAMGCVDVYHDHETDKLYV